MRHIRLLNILSLMIVLTPLTLKAQDRTDTDDNRQRTVSKRFTACVNDSLELDGSKLWFADSVLLGSRSLSVTAIKGDEIPEMEYGMVNVTVGGEGYRYLPHGTHFKETGATVQLRYDPERIPAGYTEQDIYTFYYDEQEKRWIALERVGIDREQHCVVSRTTHFTDMVNGIIQTPSMPETEGFAPTMMNDLPVADPAAKVNIIAPPAANNRGSAALSYPIEMPPARNGMTPDVSIRYDSDGGSGWLGEGWDLPVPSITVDTRWGVPRYDTAKETETYLLNGQMLSMMNGQQLTVAHRDTTVQRTADRQFYYRQGGDFSRIIRKGSSTTSYYWEVTDRNGVKYTYGGSENSRLSDESSGYIAEWKLSSIEETHGDHVEYEYEKRDEVIAGNVTAKAIYLKKIKVCHAGISDTIITVTFTSGQQKAVKTNSGRYGFLTSRNALLSGIDVKFRGSLLRAYTFTYGSGRFGKDLLTSVTHRALNDNGTLTDFATQQFSYYDEDITSNGNNLIAFNTQENILLNNKNLKGSSLANVTLRNNAPPTVLGGSHTNSYGASVYAGVGIANGDPFKGSTAGAEVGFTTDRVIGISAYFDLNGDMLPDKVYKKDNKIYFQPAVQTSGIIRYGEEMLVSGITDISKSSNNTYTSGAKSVFGTGKLTFVNAGGDISKTKTKTTHYFMDVNGDGLTDFIEKGNVKFNRLVNGIPTFVEGSDGTPNTIVQGAAIDTTMIPDSVKTVEEAEMREISPMMDAVRVWEVQRTGLVNLTGSITILPDENDNYEESDGVRATIQIGGTEIWSQVIPKGGSTTYNLTNQSVSVGQHIYFRLQAGNQLTSNGYSDRVRWMPVVTYADPCYHLTPDGQDDGVYDPQHSMVYSNEGLMAVPQNTASLTLTGTLSKNYTSDNIILKVKGIRDSDLTTEYTLLTQTLAWDEYYRNTPLTLNVNSLQNCNYVYAELSACSNVNWAETRLTLRSSSLDLDCPVRVIPLTRMLKAGEEVNFEEEVPIKVRPDVVLSGLVNDLDSLYFSVKTDNKLVFRKSYTRYSIQSSQYIDIDLRGYDACDLWFEVSYPDTMSNGGYVSTCNVYILDENNNPQMYEAAFFCRQNNELTGKMFRGWGGFVYNAGNGRHAQPIDESLLSLPTTQQAADPRTMALMPVTSNGSVSGRWNGPNEHIWFNADTVSTGRLALQDVIYDPFGSTVSVTGNGGTGAVAVIQTASTGSVIEQGGTLGLTVSSAIGHGKTDISMMDMNGDGYPDIITGERIQFTNPRGGLSDITGTGSTISTDNNATSSGIGGSPVGAVSDLVSLMKNGRTALDGKLVSDLSKINLSAGGATNEDEFHTGYIDINGDGLPDMITKDGDIFKVRLNLGYGFSPAYTLLNQEKVQYGRTTGMNLSGGASIDIASSSIAAGIGYAKTLTAEDCCLADVNGDGLPDRIVRGADGDAWVWLNTGGTFATDAMRWIGLTDLGKYCSVSQSVNVAGTIPFTLFGIKTVVNPQVYIGTGASNTISSLIDVNGDGFPDVVSSTAEDTLRVRYSTLGRTNRLKTVTNALGGTFTIDYEHTDASYDLPGGRWVMSALEVDDGIDDDGPVMRTSFEYGGGRYDRREREFLGFATVSTIELDTENADAEYRRTVETYDNQSYYHQGALTSTAVKDATGSTLSEKATSYYTYSVTPSGNAYTLTETNTVNDHGAYFVAPKYTEDRLSGTVMTQSLTKFKTSASHGELSDYYYSDKGTMNASTGSGYDYHTEIGYTDKPASLVFGLPSSVTVYGNSETYHHTTAQYNGTYPTDLTSVIHQLNSASSATTSFTYDTHGNVIRKTMPDNNLYYNYTYDTAVGMYVSGISDAFGLSSSAVYDCRYGVATQVTDANGAYTNTIIDNIGRLKSIRLPNDSQNTKSMEICYTPKSGSTPARATTTYNLRQTVSGNSLGTATDTRQTVTFADGFGRVIQTREERMLNGSSSVSVVANGRNDYDAFGRIVKSYYPAAVNGLNSFAHAQSSEKGITTEYDTLDRLLSETYPDGNGMERSYSAANHLLETTVTDPNGHSRKVRTDGSGKTVNTVRYDNNNTAITTTFTYDGIGRLTDVCDAGGNHTLSEYDMGDRRISVTHPATGTTTFTYDVMGNMTGKTTAANEHITYTYDRGRLTNITYPNHPANNVACYYGDNSEQNGRKGRLAFRDDGSGGIEYEYDNMGNVKATLRTLIIPGHGQATFRTEWIYDNFGKLLRMTYPDNDVVTYRYNACGDLTKIFKGVYENTSPRTYVSAVSYDAFGRRSTVTYGNGTQNTYTFDTDRQWLTGISVSKANTSLMDRGYQYDDVGNVTGITDINNLSHDYEYDALDRLVAADGSCGLSSATDYTTYHTETAYDNLWRITSSLYEKTWPNNASHPYFGYGLTYNYRNDRKYHLNTVEAQAYANAAHSPTGSQMSFFYEYDAKGNQTLEAYEDWYCWDEENRLTGAMGYNEDLSSYIYDADGMRTYRNSEYFIKLLVNSQQQSASSVMYYNLYPSEYYVIHNGNSYTKHVYMDDERIATLLGSDNGLLSNYSNSSTTLAGTPFISGNVSQHYAAKRMAKESDLINSLEDEFGNTYSLSDLQNTVTYSGTQVTDLPYFFHRDHSGSTALVTDSLGNVDQRIEYTPDGSAFFQNVTGSYRTPYRFNAKEYDDDTELYYFGARYYDKNLGIWISPDPLAEGYPGVSPYAYCHGNPLSRVDNDGMGDYYINGLWIGNDGKLDGKVYMNNPNGNIYFMEGVLSSAKFREWTYTSGSNRFQKFFATLIKHEGGFVNHKNDPGGATNRGITFNVFKKYSRDLLGIEPTMENLQHLQDIQAMPIYEKQYWQKSGADYIIDDQISQLYFDTYVNGGARTVLENTINAYGRTGNSISELNKLIKQYGGKSVFKTFKTERINRYEKIIKKNPQLKSFRKGWINRVNSFDYE